MYLILLFFGCILILITIVDGFKIASSPMFIIFEFILNLTVTLDLTLRVYMAGCKVYANKNKCWNKLDFVIVFGCNMLFFVSILDDMTVGEISDEVLLVMWSVIQSFRMLMIARR